MEVPTRTCLGCRRPAAKSSLIRFAAHHGTVQVDPQAVLQARGAYVCPTPGCVDAALRREGAAVARALRTGRDTVDTTSLREGLMRDIRARAGGPHGPQATIQHGEDEAAPPSRGVCT